MRHLPVITDVVDRIEIPVPCTVSWDGMKGDHAVRHCGDCKQKVYNLASFTRAEAVQLLTAHSGRVCLRIYRRPDGTVLTADCRERLRAARKRGVFVFAGVLMIVLWAQICAQVFGWLSLRKLLGGPVMGEPPAITEVAPPPDEPIRMMGKIALPSSDEPEHLMGKPASPPPGAEEERQAVKKGTKRGHRQEPPHLMGRVGRPEPLMGDVDVSSFRE